MHAQLVYENPDVYEIEVPFTNVITTETNCYVICDGDDALVVDTGAPSERSAALLAEALGELGVDASRARYFLTHLHYDHAGLVPRLAGPGACVYVNARDREALSPSYGARCSCHTCRRFQEEGVPRVTACADHSELSVSMHLDEALFDVRFVSEGDEIAVGSTRFRVVDTPGHTRGHMALFHPASGICFTGDHVLFKITPGIPLFPDGSDSLRAYCESLDKVASLGCTRLFISHGPSRTDFLERIAWLKAHHLEREDSIVEIVRDELAKEGLLSAAAASLPGAAGASSLDAVDEAVARKAPVGCDIVRRIHWNIPHASVDECEPLQRWSVYAQGIVLLDHLVAIGRLRRVPVPVDVRSAFPGELCAADYPHAEFVNHYLLA